MSQNEGVSILARYGKKMPNADAGSLDRQTQSMPTHPNHCSFETNTCKGCFGGARTRWTLLRERPSETGKSPRRRACCMGRFQRDIGKNQVEMQLVKGLNGFIHRRTRTDTSRNCNSGDSDPCHTQCSHPKLSTCFWDGVGKLESPWPVVPKARDPRQRSKNGHLWCVAAEGHHPLNEISLLNWKIFLTREVMQGRERQNKVRSNVWTKLKEEKERGERTRGRHRIHGARTRIWYQQEARTRGKIERKMERGRDRGVDQPHPCQTCK